MKTGQVARLFRIDTKTVQRWADDYAEFFSDGARGVGRTQREFSPQDLIMINTILRKGGGRRADPEKVRSILASGDLDTALPPEAVPIEGEKAIMVYTQLKVLEQQLSSERVQREAAEAALAKEREQHEQYEKRLREMEREIGKWQAFAELYEKLWKEERDGKP